MLSKLLSSLIRDTSGLVQDFSAWQSHSRNFPWHVGLNHISDIHCKKPDSLTQHLCSVRSKYAYSVKSDVFHKDQVAEQSDLSGPFMWYGLGIDQALLVTIRKRKRCGTRVPLPILAMQKTMTSGTSCVFQCEHCCTMQRSFTWLHSLRQSDSSLPECVQNTMRGQ